MFRVTLQLGPSEHLSLRVANQDLARILALAPRLRFLNPDFDVTYSDEARASGAGAA